MISNTPPIMKAHLDRQKQKNAMKNYQSWVGLPRAHTSMKQSGIILTENRKTQPTSKEERLSRSLENFFKKGV